MIGAFRHDRAAHACRTDAPMFQHHRRGPPSTSHPQTAAASAMNNPIRSSSLCQGFRRGGKLLAVSGKNVTMASATSHLFGRRLLDRESVCRLVIPRIMMPRTSHALLTAMPNDRPRWRFFCAAPRSKATKSGLDRISRPSSILTVSLPTTEVALVFQSTSRRGPSVRA